MLTETLRTAVIGTGLIGRKHIRLIAGHPRFALAATVNPSGGPTDMPEVMGVPNFVSHREMIKGDRIQAAIVSSPNESHAEIAIDLIEAGVPVLIEKPITGCIDDGKRIIAAATKCNVPVLMGHHRRHNPIIAEMATLICERRLGPLVGFSGTWAVYKPDPYYKTAWRVGATGGPIMINLIHEIDYLHAMVGPIVSVGAMQGAKRRNHAGEEAVGLLLRFGQGEIGTIFLSDSAASPWSWEQATGESVPSFPMTAESPYRFLFCNGAIEFPRLKIWEQSEPSWTNDFRTKDVNRLKASMREVFAKQLEHFYWVATGSAKPIVTARDGLEALNVAMTVKKAIASGSCSIDVPKIF